MEFSHSFVDEQQANEFISFVTQKWAALHPSVDEPDLSIEYTSHGLYRVVACHTQLSATQWHDWVNDFFSAQSGNGTASGSSEPERAFDPWRDAKPMKRRVTSSDAFRPRRSRPSNLVSQCIKRFRETPMVLGVLFLCILVFIGFYAGYSSFLFSVLTISGWESVQNPAAWYRLFSPNVMHFSALHLLMNMLWWWYFGRQIEHVHGTIAVVRLFVIASLAANISQLVLQGPNFGGMSGVVYGSAAYIFYHQYRGISRSLYIPPGLFFFMLVWLVVGFAEVLPFNMANWAHLFGLVGGFAAASLFPKNK